MTDAPANNAGGGDPHDVRPTAWRWPQAATAAKTAAWLAVGLVGYGLLGMCLLQGRVGDVALFLLAAPVVLVTLLGPIEAVRELIREMQGKPPKPAGGVQASWGRGRRSADRAPDAADLDGWGP